MKPRYLMIVKPAAGLVILDTPRPRGEGAQVRRTLMKGAQVYAYEIFNFQGVPYAMLVPADPLKPEWARVSEKGSLVPEYLDKIEIDMTPENDSGIVRALNNIAQQLGRIADAIHSP